MILTHSVKVCLATQPCDLRKSFNTLSCVVEEQLKEDPLSSKLFVFLNKRADRVKMLYVGRQRTLDFDEKIGTRSFRPPQA